MSWSRTAIVGMLAGVFPIQRVQHPAQPLKGAALSHARKVLGLAAATALAVLAPSISAASAAMTTSSASADKAFAFNDLTAATPGVRHITATSDGAGGDPVSILCMQGATSDHSLGSTTLGPGGALSYDVLESAIGDSLCR